MGRYDPMTDNTIPDRYKQAILTPEIDLELNKSFYLWGEVGAGKTTFAYGLKIQSAIHHENDGHYPRIVIRNLVDLIDDLKSTDYKERNHKMEDVTAYKFLVIDDLGAEIPTDFSNQFLFRLINTRWNNKRWTGFTSNFELKDLPETYDQRLISRIAGLVGENRYYLNGKDLRVAV